jgi:DNA-directed RNA polymerase alpha subunit
MIKIINKSDEKISFTTNISPSLANAIRRSVNYIPILAVTELEISKNDSALYDEIIAHRVGLIPLKNENLKLSKDCDCGKEEGCGKCSIKLKLSVQGPATVYSTEISPKGSVIYKMPIAILDKEQELEFVAIAKMGLGIEHAKFAPGMLYYRYSQDLENKDEEGFRKFLYSAKKEDENEITVFVESWGQIKAKEIFIESIDVLNKEVKELVKKIK